MSEKQYFGILSTTINDEYHERKIFDDPKILQSYLNNMVNAAELIGVKLTYTVDEFEATKKSELGYSGMRNFDRRLKVVKTMNQDIYDEEVVCSHVKTTPSQPYQGRPEEFGGSDF